MGLKGKTLIGVFWVSVSAVLMKVINFIISIILARLLDPKDFGLVAMGLILVNFFEMFRKFGIGTSLIYKKEDVDKAANAAFFIFPIVAMFFYLISYFTAPIAADFFRDNNLEIIIKVLSLSFVIWSFGSLPTTLLIKDLEFKKMIIPQIIPKIAYGTIAISMAVNGFGIWSLVVGRLVLEILSVILMWYYVDWRPSYKFDMEIAFELINYGKHVMAADTILFLMSVIDITFVGRILGSENLGYYTIAFGIAGLMTTQVSTIFSQVLFPTFSKLQTNKDNLKEAYLRILKYLSIVIIPAAFGIAAIAWDFVKVVYGTKWLPAVAVLQVLCFYGLNRSLLDTTEQLYLATGKPEIRTRLNLIQLILTVVLMYPLTIRYGIFGTSIAVIIPSILIVFLTFKEAGKIIGESFIYITRMLLPATACSIIIFLVIWGWQSSSPALSPILRLAISVFIGSSVYVAYIWLKQRDMLYEIRELILGRKNAS